MPSSWPRHTVAQLQADGVLLVEDGNHGEYRPRTAEFGVGKWAFIRAADMDNGTVLFDSAERINDVAFKRIRKGIGKGGDILFSHKGTVGKLAIAPLDAPLFICSPQTTFWRTLKETTLSRRFLYYFMQSRAFTEQWMGRKGETDMADYVSLTAQRELFVSVPPLAEQKVIAEVLGSIDDKIEQNRRTGRALEGLARAVFKAWFVDFAPVKAKAAGAIAFPGMPPDTFAALPTAFHPSLGHVPQGWEIKRAIDVVAVAIGKTPPRKEPQWFSTDPSNIPWASISDMGSCGVFIRATSEYLTAASVDRFNVRRIPPGSVLFSFKLTIGRVAITDGEITSNEAIAHFVPASPNVIGPEYLYCYLSSFDHSQLGSTSSIATATNSKAIKAMPVLVPDDVTAASFANIVRPVFDLIRSLSRESTKLADLRDYLLPRLLSGRVRVSNSKALTQGVPQ